MKKSILNKLIFTIIGTAFILILMSVKSNASSLSITTSKSSVSPGGTFTVTVSVSGGAGKVSTSVSNGSGGKTDFLDNSSYSFTCTAGNSGSVTISASGRIADYNTEKDENKSASKTVKIVSNAGGNSSGGKKTSSSSGGTTKSQESEKSKDSTLSAFEVKEGAISPEFKKDVKEYTLTVPYETTEVNVTATPTDSKAKVEVKGNKDLKEGENVVTVTVTAEDGSTTDYIIKVTRARVPLALKTLVIKYENQQGELIEVPLNPTFAFDILEYSIEDLEYWVENLSVEAVANLEGAEINIQGADNLQVGENTITIALKIAGDEKNLKVGEDLKDETITYTIKVNKKEEPTIFGKISNGFKGFMGTISVWYGQNEEKVIIGALGICNVALLILSIYIVVDYRKYKDVIANVKKTEEINNSSNIIEEIHQKSNDNENDNIEENDNDNKQKGGKHF